MSHRYISDRQLPDKAIDLVDEAASRLRIEIDSMPYEIDVLDRRIRRLDIEQLGGEIEFAPLRAKSHAKSTRTFLGDQLHRALAIERFKFQQLRRNQAGPKRTPLEPVFPEGPCG